jgi:CelD/BcsL family acetyltransferase involved in cellulose biosynthesis
VKSARKKIQKLGRIRVEVAKRETLDELLEALFRLHETRWSEAGQAGVFANEQVRCFHQRVAPVLLDKGVLRLYGLRLNGQIIASLYALFEKEIAYCYLQGFDPAFAEVSPGAQILAAVIEDAIHERKTAVDFLRGREAYKYAWGARDVPTYRLCGRKPAPISQVSPGIIAA